MKTIHAIVAVMVALLVVGMPVFAARDVTGRDALVKKAITSGEPKVALPSQVDSTRPERGGLTREEAVAKALEQMGIVLQEQYFKFNQYVDPIVRYLKACGVSKGQMSLFMQQLNNAKDTLGAAQQQTIWAWMNYKWHKYGVAIDLLKQAKANWGLFKIQLTTLANFKKQLEAQYECRAQ